MTMMMVRALSPASPRSAAIRREIRHGLGKWSSEETDQREMGTRLDEDHGKEAANEMLSVCWYFHHPHVHIFTLFPTDDINWHLQKRGVRSLELRTWQPWKHVLPHDVIGMAWDKIRVWDSPLICQFRMYRLCIGNVLILLLNGAASTHD